MNKACTKCGASMGTDTQTCIKCGQAELEVSRLKFAPRVREKMETGCFTKLLFVYLMCTLIVALIETCFPSRAMLYANMNVVADKGTNVYWAIKGIYTNGESSTIPQVWPVICVGTNQPAMISTSTDYFKIIYDEAHYGGEAWNPLARKFNYTQLSGVGVPNCDNKQLMATHNMWSIAANVTSEDDPRIPILLTRNVDAREIERVVNQGLKKSEFKTRITFSTMYKSPFSNKGFVAVRKDGRTICITKSRKATLGELFANQEFPPRDPSKPKIVYLMP